MTTPHPRAAQNGAGEGTGAEVKHYQTTRRRVRAVREREEA